MTIGEKTIKNEHFLLLKLEKTLLNEETWMK
jgi:hypothetical protein